MTFKNLILAAILFITANTFSQNKKTKIWEALLQNDRKTALELSEKVKTSKADMETLILKQIVRVENGILSKDKQFNDAFIAKKDFDIFMFPLWNNKELFADYLVEGFNKNILESVDFYYDKNIKNTTVKGGITYLKGISERYRNNFEKYYKLSTDLLAVSDWQYCGVFENLNDSGMDYVYPPEKVALSTEMFDANSNGKINWFDVDYSVEGYQFMRNHEEYGNGINYAQTFFETDKETTLILKFGLGVSSKIWLNDTLIFQEPDNHITEMDAHAIKVTIPKGKNRILIKLTNKAEAYFILRVFDENNQLLNPKTLHFTNKYSDYNKGNLIKNKVLANYFEDYFLKLDSKKFTPFIKDYLLVKTYLRNGKTKPAKEIILKNLKKYPKSSFLRSLLVITANKAKDYDLATEVSENRKNDDPDYMLVLVESLQDTEKLFKLSVEEMNKKLEKIKNATDLEIFKRTAELLKTLRAQDKDGFKKNLDSIYSMSKKYQSAKLMTVYASLYGTMFSDDQKAINLLEDIYTNYFSFGAYQNLLSYYKKKNDKEKTINLYEDFTKKLSDDLYPIKNYVQYLNSIEKYENSLTISDKGLKMFPYSFLLMKYKADALLQLKKEKEALKWYKKSYSHDSGNATLRSKIQDLEKIEDPIQQFLIKDIYAYIKENRGKKTDKSYDLNILRSEQIVELFKEGGNRSRNIDIYEINTEAGIEMIKEYNLGLYYGYTIYKSEIIKPDNKIVPAEKSGSNFVFNNLSIGDVVLIDYETSSNKTGRFYKDFIDSFQFGTFYPANAFIYRMIVPKDVKIFSKTTLGEVPFTKKKSGKFIIYTWEQNNPEILPPSEPYKPVTVDIATFLHIDTIDKWSVISNWYSDLVRTQIEYDQTVLDAFNSIFPNGYSSLSKEERAKKIYYYLMNNLTYSYVSFKQSGYIPQKPAKTIKTKLGDCKDFSTLFLTLAKKAEVPTNLVLISTSDLGLHNLVLPSTEFNHCIVRVDLDGKEQYLELTDKNLSFKTLPVSLENALALNIPYLSSDDNKEDLLVLTNLNQNKTIIKNTIDLNINNDTQTLKTTVLTTGKLNSTYRDLLSEKNEEKLQKALTKHFENREDLDLTLNSYKIIQNKKEIDTTEFTTDFSVHNKIKKLGKFKLLKLPMFYKPYTDNIVNLEKRHYPIVYNKYERVDQYILKYTIRLDSEQKFIEIPENVNYNFKKHHYSIQYSKINDQELHVEIIADIDRQNIQPEDYPQYRTFVKNILEANETLIGFK